VVAFMVLLDDIMTAISRVSFLFFVSSCFTERKQDC
jgi:hypothetical protein